MVINFTQTADLLLVGQANYVGSVSRHPLLFIDMLKNELRISFKHTNEYKADWIPEEIRTVIEASEMAEMAPVALLTDVVWLPGHPIYTYVPETFLKYAYSMTESSKLLPEWVAALNNHFDAVLVPDPYVVEVYKKSGVRIPIFMLPLPIFLDKLLAFPLKKKPHKPFVFGCSAIYEDRKNLDRLIEAFTYAFNRSPDTILKIHTKSAYRQELLERVIAEQKNLSIKLTVQALDENAYADFMRSLDCYVFLSKGEGFSITPREALAAGIPCVITDNTAQATICRSGFVYCVKSALKERGVYDFNGPDELKKSVDIGYRFNCTVTDAARAMRKVYYEYDAALEKALHGRKWVKQYRPEALKKKYLSLLAPKKVLFGRSNNVTEKYVVTNSTKLYTKLRRLALHKSPGKDL